MVVLAGPVRPLTDGAISALKGYLNRGGRLLVLANPRGAGDKLPPFLADWGIKLGRDIVIDREVRLFEGPRLGVVPLARNYGTHPITQGFRDFTVYPQTASVEPVTSPRKRDPGDDAGAHQRVELGRDRRRRRLHPGRRRPRRQRHQGPRVRRASPSRPT